jgi:hypothetical protein
MAKGLGHVADADLTDRLFDVTTYICVGIVLGK